MVFRKFVNNRNEKNEVKMNKPVSSVSRLVNIRNKQSTDVWILV